MKLTLSSYEKKTVNSSGGTLTVLAITGTIELAFLGVDEIPLETGDQIPLGDVAKVSFQNIGDSEAVIDYIISSKTIDKKSQSMRIENEILKVELDRDVSIGAVNQDGDWAVGNKAADSASDIINITLLTGETKEILPVNNNRSVATIIRGESDLYNIKLGYNTAANAQAGLPFSPQASASIKVKASVWAHNHSTETQTVIAVDTSINSGV